jgi:predicted RNA-binding protein with TRAM domain
MVRSERRSFGFKRMNIPKPVKVGEEYDVEINEVGSRGDGIARIKNFVVFVSNAKKGEKMKIKITDVRNRFALAEKIGEVKKEEEKKEVSPEE